MYALNIRNLTLEDQAIVSKLGVVTLANYRNADLLSLAFTTDDLLCFGSVRAAVRSQMKCDPNERELVAGEPCCNVSRFGTHSADCTEIHMRGRRA